MNALRLARTRSGLALLLTVLSLALAASFVPASAFAAGGATDPYTLGVCRIYDSRVSGGPIVINPPDLEAIRTIPVIGGACGLPADTRHVTLNVTVVEATAPGQVSLSPGDIAPPALPPAPPGGEALAVAGLYFDPGFPGRSTLPNPMTVQLAGDGSGTIKVAARLRNQPAAGAYPLSFHLVLDINAHFRDSAVAQDDAPPDIPTVPEDSAPTTIDVRANDLGPPGGGPFSIDSVTQPANGEVVITNSGADLTYEPNPDYCNSPGGTPDTFTYTLEPSPSTATVSMTVICSNDAPVVDLDPDDSGGNRPDFTATFTEGSGGVKIGDTDLATSDADDTNLQSATITLTNRPDGDGVESLSADTTGTAITALYTPATGVLALTGPDTVANFQQVLRTVEYDNTSINPDTTARSITVVADDGDDVSATVTSTINIGATNDAPELTAGGVLNYAEDDPPTAIDTTITVSDDDDTNLESATAQITGNYQNGQDVLSFVDTPNITGVFTAATGTLTLTGTDTLANWQTALRSVRYNNTSDNPSTLARTVTWIASDGSDPSAPVTSTINVSTTNDAPELTAGGVLSYTENDPPAAIDTTITVSDDDDTNLESATAQITGNYQNGADVLSFVDTPNITGVFTAATGTLTLTGTDTLANWQTAMRSVRYNNTSDNPSTLARTVTWIASDGSASSTPVTSTVNVSATNDAPELTAGGVLNYAEGDPPAAIDTTITVSDDDDTNLESATAQITGNYQNGADVLSFVNTPNITGIFTPATGTLTLTGSDTLTNWQTALRSVRYNNTSDNPSTLARTVTWIASDGSDPSAPVTSTINVSTTNDAPELTAGGALTYTENDPPAAIDTTITVSDDDDTNLESATAQITGNYQNGQDVLSFVNTPNITAIFTAATGTLTLTGSDTLANWQTALRSVRYHNTSDNPSTLARTVTWIANDGDASSTPVTSTINISAVNDAPELTAGGALSYTENDPPTAIDTTITVNDDDNTNLQSATAQITMNYQNGQDVLSFVNTPNITAVFTAATGTLTLTGSDTLANWQTALRSVRYHNTSDNPSTLTRTVTWIASDGSALSTPVTSTINVTAVPDAPTCNPLPGALNYSTPGNTQLHAAGATLPGVTSISDPKNALTAANATDADGPPPITVVPFSGNTSGGDWVLNGDGSFTFVPNAGFTGPATLAFQVKDNGGATGSCATINVNVGPRVWYIHDVVDGNNPAGGDGRSTNAFDSVTAFNTAATDNNGDIIFVFEGNTGATPHTGSITLKDGQKLWGQGIALNVPGFGTPLVTATNKPRIRTTTASTNVVSVPATAGNRSNVEIRGLDLEATGATSNAIDVTSSGGNTVGITINDNNVRGATAEGIDLNAGATAAFSATVQNNTVTAAGNGIDTRVSSTGTTTVTASSNMITSTGGNAFDARTLAGASALRVALDSSNVAAAGTGILIDGSVAGTTTITGFANNVVDGSTVGTGISITSATFDANTTTAGFQQVSGGNTVVGATGVGNGVGGSGIFMTNVAGDLAFTDLSVFAEGVGGTGLRINGTGAVNTGAGTGTRVTVNSAAPGRIIEATGGPAVDVNNATIDLQLSSLKSTTTSTGVSLVNVSDGSTTNAFFSAPSGSSITASSGAGPAFNVSGGNAKITYGGTITNNGTGRAVSIATWSGDDAVPGDDLLLSGAIDENGAGILVNGNGGSRSITFSGGMDIDTTTGEGFAATSNTNTGGLHITGTNDITSTSATALRVTSTTIGSSNLNFRNISSGNNTAAADPASGIVLSNTGSLGGLTVTGTGSADSGGIIQNTTSHGISLTSTLSPSFSRMRIQNTAGNGVRGTQVTNFTFTNGTIDNSGTDLAAERSNIAFNDTAAGTENNLSGTVTITGNTLTNAYYHGVDIFNFNGTIADATISSNTITSTSSTATSKGSGIRFVAFGSATTVANVTKATIANNVVSNFPSATGIQAQGGNGNAAGPAGVFGTSGSATNVIAITGNRVAGFSPAIRLGAFAILANVNGKGQGNFDISGNGTAANPVTNVIGNAISQGSFGQAIVTSNINNNVIVANNQAGAQGIGAGTSQTFGAADTPSLTVTISNNQISQTDGNGILVTARDATGTVRAKIQNNTVAAPLGGNRNGIRVDAGNAVSVNDSVCLNISGNTSAGVGLSPEGIGLRKQGTIAATNNFALHGFATSPANQAQTAAYSTSQNPGSASGTLIISGDNFNSPTCSFP